MQINTTITLNNGFGHLFSYQIIGSLANGIFLGSITPLTYPHVMYVTYNNTTHKFEYEDSGGQIHSHNTYPELLRSHGFVRQVVAKLTK